MASQTFEVVLPIELVHEIDAEVGPEARNEFLAESAAQALQRSRLRAFLASEEPIWKDENYPELAAMGTEAWVQAMRLEGEARLADLHREE